MWSYEQCVIMNMDTPSNSVIIPNPLANTNNRNVLWYTIRMATCYRSESWYQALYRWFKLQSEHNFSRLLLVQLRKYKIIVIIIAINWFFWQPIHLNTIIQNNNVFLMSLAFILLDSCVLPMFCWSPISLGKLIFPTSVFRHLANMSWLGEFIWWLYYLLNAKGTESKLQGGVLNALYLVVWNDGIQIVWELGCTF